MLRYKVYALPPTAENIELAQARYRYYRATKSHLLVYTEKRRPAGSVLVKEPEKLPLADQGWIQGCNVLITEEVMRNEPSAQERMMDFLSALDKELSKELRGA